MIAKALLFLIVGLQIPTVTPVIHTLKYFRTASTKISTFPAYVEVGYVDGVAFVRYDSDRKKAQAQQDWMEEIAADDPDYWETETQRNVVNENVFRVNIGIAQERFNHTGGVHVLQWMFGCEWNDENGQVDGWNRHSYDGEDFISLDTRTMSYVAAKPQAFVTKLKWDRDEDRKKYRKHYYAEICPSALKKLLRYGRSVLVTTKPPKVSLLQKTPSSPITCHASGFYPDVADLFWRRDGEQIHHDVELGQTLPNHDGTFQMTADLTAAEAAARYECVFQQPGVDREIVTKLERRNILSNRRNEEEEKIKKIVTIAAPSAAATALLVVIAVVVSRHKCKRDDYDPASTDGGAELSESRTAET
ncbi:H-2 class I histocompatibility antigen, Q9 alpha chain-like [Syngnathoides biaculeatus]|uniref:H-2 class I histocompatibility antigen, Q9 alpha chain-like n=1 Tax=Syngnathoides biaculeatus TaxID=300417 RepID=UPI002ADE24A5|nr:H-2 class I histocompatibility antigen, Q9 alpha chain-like [Syngnathoides biaculeatus]